MSHFVSYSEIEAHLEELGLFHMDLTLDRMRGFADVFGKPGYAVAQVVGTNGKGSVSEYLAAIFSAHGLKSGLSTSPHFIDVRERILVDRAKLSRAVWLEAANQVRDAAGGAGLTYFEFLTCLAMAAFRALGVEVAVMEAGLGGAFDAVNVFAPDLTVFTPIDLDHEAVLGSTVQEIARDKAGAMKPGGLALTGEQRPEVVEILARVAEDVGCRLLQADDVLKQAFHGAFPAIAPGMAGPHQEDNARLALAGAALLADARGWNLRPSACEKAIAIARVPGRIQYSSGTRPPMILDGAHNPHALAALERALIREGVRPSAMVFTCFKDKNLDGMLPVLRRLATGPVLVPGMGQWERSRNPEATASAIGHGARAVQSVSRALEELDRDPGPVLVCGSLYLLAEVYKTYPHLLDRDKIQTIGDL